MALNLILQCISRLQIYPLGNLILLQENGILTLMAFCYSMTLKQKIKVEIKGFLFLKVNFGCNRIFI